MTILWAFRKRPDRYKVLEMIVNMDCHGCESKVRKALRKIRGVDNIYIDMALQKVTVTGWADHEKILRRVRRTGRKADRWPYPPNVPEYHASSQYFNNQYYYHSNPLLYFTSKPRSMYDVHHNENGYHKNVREDDYHHGQSYYNHEYDHGYYNHLPPRPISNHGDVRSMFSDENANACSIL